MQPNGKLCFVEWLLAVLLAWYHFDVSMGNPVKLGSLDMENCALLSRTLLSIMTDALEHGSFFSGINCTEQSAEMDTRTQTVSACEPNPRQDTSCHGQRSTKFDKTECLKNVGQDLKYYRNALLAHSDHELASRLVKTIDDFMEVPAVRGNTFSERLRLCRLMKGFRVRTITINRVMSYIAAGDDKM